MMNAPIAPFIAHEKKDAFEMEQPNRGGLTRLIFKCEGAHSFYSLSADFCSSCSQIT